MMQTKFLLNQNCAEGHLGSKGAPAFPAPGFAFYSPLSVALFSVLFHAGSHGLSVCEALKNLVRQGYSKLLNSNVHTRAVQVKFALRSCPAFKEIEGKRFVLRCNRQNDCTISPMQCCKREKAPGKKHRKIDKDSVKNEESTAAIERGLGVQKRTIQEEDMHLVGSDTKEIERCCPLDPKHCGCIQHTSLGSLYSDCSDQSGREDIKESASAFEDGKDLGMVSCHVKDANQEDKLQVGRCRRTDGKRWRCRKTVQPGSIYCEHHHIMRRGGYKTKVVDGSKVGEKSPLHRPSEALSGKCVVKEEEGLCLEPLKLADGSLQVSAAQSVATLCKLLAKEELIEAQCETKPFLHTIESHNSGDAQTSKTEEKLAGPGQLVLAMVVMQEGQKEKPPALHIYEEERCDQKEETKQYLHRVGVDEHADVERSKEANSTGHGQLVTFERMLEEGQQKAKPDLNTLEEEVPEEEVEEGEHHHLMGTKASVEGPEMVLKADVDSQLQASIIPFKDLTSKDGQREAEKVLVKSLRLATGPFGGSIAQVEASASNALVEGKSHKGHKETRPFLPTLELNDLEGVQRLKKKPKLIGHPILLEKHGEREEKKPGQHVLERLRYEAIQAKQETASKLDDVVVETHNSEDACRPSEAPRLEAGHGQIIMPEKPEHRGQKIAEVDSPAPPALEGSDHMQISQGDSVPGFYKSLTMLVPKKEATFTTFEDGSKMHRGKGFHIEPSNLAATSEISSQNPKRRLVEQGDSSPYTQALFPDGSLHVSKKSQSPTGSNDLPGQCHRNDGKGWRCSRQCQPGCMYCEHHEGRLSTTSGKKKMILQLELDKHVLATCLKGSSETQIFRVAIDVPETLAEGLKTKVSNRTGRLLEGITAAKDNDALPLGQCHRKDGKGWQCAQQCKHGSIYCDRHQRQRSKSRFPRVHSQHKLAFFRGPDVQNLECSSNIYTDDKQLALSAMHISNSGLEHALKPQSRSQDIETRSGKQDDVGLALLSLRTPVGTPAKAFHGSCLWESKTLEQTGKAEFAPKKCHRKDGKKWQCSRLCMPGYNHCEHHQGRGRKVKVIKT